MDKNKIIFNFGEIVITDKNLIGVVVKCWTNATYDVYVRYLNGIREYDSDEIRKYIYDKELVITPPKTLRETEKEAIKLALEKSNHNRSKAAELLEIGERTIYRRIKEFNLDSDN